MKIWNANYEGNKIRIENSWFLGEKLYVNNKLQDEKVSIFSSNLTGHIVSKDGEKIPIKVNLSGLLTIECRLFIDDEKIEVTRG